ncbi:MAG: GPW/gp25 family protein [Saprospiraceae bacterium]|nr:GPW/gp25 family protein [Saprospiraceae bacterium]
MANGDIQQNFLGRGWSFPPTFDYDIGSVQMLEEVEDIYSSLHILLTTITGERIMQPRFGCNLEELLFESIDSTLKTLIIDKIETSILYFESRIKPLRIDLIDDLELEGKLLIEVDFIVKSTNSRFNFVFPFYKNEGSQILNFLISAPISNEGL